MSYYCPVCAYDQLDEPAANHNLCPCCGTQFGYHDVGHSWVELREAWLLKGAPWFSTYTRPPKDWNPIAQLQQLASLETIQARADRTDESPVVQTKLPQRAA